MAGKSVVAASEEQKAALRTLAGSRDRGEADQARAVLLTLSGWTSPRTAKPSAFARIRCAAHRVRRRACSDRFAVASAKRRRPIAPARCSSMHRRGWGAFRSAAALE